MSELLEEYHNTLENMMNAGIRAMVKADLAKYQSANFTLVCHKCGHVKPVKNRPLHDCFTCEKCFAHNERQQIHKLASKENKPIHDEVKQL